MNTWPTVLAGDTRLLTPAPPRVGRLDSRKGVRLLAALDSRKGVRLLAALDSRKGVLARRPERGGPPPATRRACGRPWASSGSLAGTRGVGGVHSRQSLLRAKVRV